jgi:RNA polymerase sigma-70 factor (ECF subfamily)
MLVPDQIRSLVQRCLAGEQAAVTALVERFQGLVFGLCLRMIGRRHDAEDVAQESLVRAIRGLHRFDAARDFEPWLLAIAGNRCRTFLANRRRRPDARPLVDDAADDTPPMYAAESLAEEVQRALTTLRAEYRQAFLLFHQHELSYADIAAALAVPLGTVKTWVHRARQELIEQLRNRGVIDEVGYALRKV